MGVGIRDDAWKWTRKHIWAVLLIFRFCNTLTVQTYHVPDEHWQSLEVAHQLVFGYGHLTWEWREHIRSYIFPLLYALPFAVLRTFRLDYVFAMVSTRLAC